jgi:hypothetical protein
MDRTAVECVSLEALYPLVWNVSLRSLAGLCWLPPRTVRYSVWLTSFLDSVFAGSVFLGRGPSLLFRQAQQLIIFANWDPTNADLVAVFP